MERSTLATNYIIISLVLTSLFACGQGGKKMPAEHLLINPIAFEERLNSEENPQLIDVRTPSEFQSGTIKDAKNWNLMDGTFERKLNELDSSETVYVFCAKGGRSGKAATLLEEKGFSSIIDLKGGYGGWKQLQDKRDAAKQE